MAVATADTDTAVRSAWPRTVHRGARMDDPQAMVPLLDADPELGAGLDERTRSQLRRLLLAQLILLGAGWAGADCAAALEGWAIVLDGVLVRRVAVWGRGSIELLGPGDVLLPGPGESWASHPATTTWRVLVPARIGRLDADAFELIHRFPALGMKLTERVAQRSQALSARLAIVQMPRLEDRLVAVLWQLADRWGYVRGDQVHIALRISHALLAELVSAQRPPISLALGRLERDGAIGRAADGTWWLRR
jgi:CRP/FNR family transcriptional regulator, cyclic AMP receptor protein